MHGIESGEFDQRDLALLDKTLTETLGALARDWEHISETIAGSQIGKHRIYRPAHGLAMVVNGARTEDANTVHVIRYQEGRFEIMPELASRYFGTASEG